MHVNLYATIFSVGSPALVVIGVQGHHQGQGPAQAQLREPAQVQAWAQVQQVEVWVQAQLREPVQVQVWE